MASLTEEIKSDHKLLGYFDYKNGIILSCVLCLIAIIFVFIMFDEVVRMKYVVVIGFNLMCLGVTYLMRGQLDISAQRKAKAKEDKAIWDAKSEAEKMAEFNKFFPVVNMTPEEAAKHMQAQEESKKKK